jgi:microcin C transport system ATP-binding protein
MELLKQPETILRGIRGKRISMIFQEPMVSLNPLHTVQKQIGEMITQHHPLPKKKKEPG